MEQYYILKPKKLDLTVRIEKYKPDFKVNIDFLYFFISGIIEQTQYQLGEQKKKIDWNLFENSFDVKKYFIPRHSKILQRYCQDYKRHIQLLLHDSDENGRVLWGQQYVVGERSFSYQLSPYLFYGEMELYKITNKNLLGRINKHNKSPRIDNQVRAKYNFLIQYFDKNRLTMINSEKAMLELDDKFKETKNYHKYLSNTTKVKQFLNGEFPLYNKKHTDGRVHTLITQFPRKIRKYLRYDNEILGEVDLSASIPFIIYYILDKVQKGIATDISGYINNKYLISHYMLGKNARTLCPKEIAHFGELIIKNKLYEHFVNDFKFICAEGEDLNKFCKKRILSMLFARTDQYKNEQFIFQKYFPTIHQFLKGYKKSYMEELKGKGQYKKLSYLGFQIESYFMLHLIARGFNNFYKRKKIILTLHDALITKISDINILRSYMEEVFKYEMGFVPNLKIKYWADENKVFEILSKAS